MLLYMIKLKLLNNYCYLCIKTDSEHIINAGTKANADDFSSDGVWPDNRFCYIYHTFFVLLY